MLEGGSFVVIILLLTLGNLRAALIVAAAIPISMMFSFMGMKAMGITANIMSLGAIDFGMIVDGSIVMVENSLRKLAAASSGRVATSSGLVEGDELLAAQTPQGDKPLVQPATNFEIIQESVREMGRPIFFGVLIITVVYMPILTLEGMEFKMFSPMVFTVCFALLGSLVTALTFIPVMCSLLLRGKVKEWESFIIAAVRRPYTVLLGFCLQHKAITVSLAFALLAATIISVPYLGTEFVPRLEEGNIIIETRNLPSISLCRSAQSINKHREIPKACA